MRGKKLFTFVEIDDSTPIQRLSVSEQLRALVRRLAQDDREQLRAEDAETVYLLQLKADLLEFIYKATEKLRHGEHSSVTVSLSSKFLPVLDEVLGSPAITTYYTVSVSKPTIDYDVEYFFTMRLEVRAY